MFRQRARQSGIILAVWTALGVFYGWEVYLFKLHAHQPLPLHVGILRALPDYWLYAALTPLVLGFSARCRFQRKQWAARAGIHLLAALAFLTLWTTLKVAFYPVEDLIMGDASPRTWYLFRTLMVDNANDALWFYGTIVAVSELLHYQRKTREREMRAARLESQLARAQPDAPGCRGGRPDRGTPQRPSAYEFREWE